MYFSDMQINVQKNHKVSGKQTRRFVSAL